MGGAITRRYIMIDNDKQAVERGCYSNKYQRHLVRRFIIQKKLPASLEAILSVIPKGKSIIDIGASIGRYFPYFEEAGYKVSGIDGSVGIEKITKGKVTQFDLTSPRVHDLHGIADWGLFIEVGEHIPKEFEDTVIDNVCQIPREGLIVAWANVGAIGRGHVNCHNEKHVVEQFHSRGWFIDEILTKLARSKLRKKSQHTLVMIRNETCQQS